MKNILLFQSFISLFAGADPAFYCTNREDPSDAYDGDLDYYKKC